MENMTWGEVVPVACTSDTTSWIGIALYIMRWVGVANGLMAGRVRQMPKR